VPQAGSQIVSAGSRLHDLDDRLDEGARREVPAGAGLRLLGVLLQEPFVRLAFDVGVEGHPALGVDQVDDEAPQLGRVLDAVLCLAEDRAEHARQTAELGEDMAVVNLELVAVEPHE
jgi:hypothetical protein